MKPFTKIASALLALIAVAHIVRAAFGWVVTINGAVVPMWASIVAAVITGGLSAMLCRECRCAPGAATT